MARPGKAAEREQMASEMQVCVCVCVCVNVCMTFTSIVRVRSFMNHAMQLIASSHVCIMPQCIQNVRIRSICVDSTAKD